jgi:hypothetical protein
MNLKLVSAVALAASVIIGAAGLTTAQASVPTPTPSPTSTYTVGFGAYNPSEDCSSFDINKYRIATIVGETKLHKVFNARPSDCWMRYFLHVNMEKNFFVDVVPYALPPISPEAQDALIRKVENVITTLTTDEITSYGFDLWTHKVELRFQSEPTAALVAKIRKLFAKTPASAIISLPGDADYQMDLRSIDQIMVNDGEAPIYSDLYTANAYPSALKISGILVQQAQKPKQVVKKVVVKKKPTKKP